MADRAEPCFSWGSVGVGQTKGLLRGPEYGGLPASKGLVFPQRKIHDFVPEEMSHLHSEQEVFGNTERSIRRIKCKRNLRSILKTKINCSILRTAVFAK